jgi:hypothetical protein
MTKYVSRKMWLSALCFGLMAWQFSGPALSEEAKKHSVKKECFFLSFDGEHEKNVISISVTVGFLGQGNDSNKKLEEFRAVSGYDGTKLKFESENCEVEFAVRRRIAG